MTRAQPLTAKSPASWICLRAAACPDKGARRAAPRAGSSCLAIRFCLGEQTREAAEHLQIGRNGGVVERHGCSFRVVELCRKRGVARHGGRRRNCNACKANCSQIFHPSSPGLPGDRLRRREKELLITRSHWISRLAGYEKRLPRAGSAAPARGARASAPAIPRSARNPRASRISPASP